MIYTYMSKNLLKLCFAVSVIAAVVFASYETETETIILPTHTQAQTQTQISLTP